MSETRPSSLTRADLEAEGATALPAKEVVSLLDLNLNLDLALDLAAPIDLAVAANANVAAPIDAAVAANVLSAGSTAQALADQDGTIDQLISGEAIAHSGQDSSIDQGNDVVDPAPTPGPGVVEPPDSTTGGILEGDLLELDVDVQLDADIAAPIAGAVAANANVAAPIDAAVAANVASIASSATAVADQDVDIVQHLDDVTAEATADQTSDIVQ